MQFLSTLEKKKWKPFQHPAEVTSPSCSITDCCTVHLVHQALNSVVLAKGACSGDGANYCVHDVFHFLAQSDSFWVRQWKESSFISLQNGVLFSLLITEIGNIAKCLIIFDQFTLLWDFPQGPKELIFWCWAHQRRYV